MVGIIRDEYYIIIYQALFHLCGRGFLSFTLFMFILDVRKELENNLMTWENQGHIYLI